MLENLYISMTLGLHLAFLACFLSKSLEVIATPYVRKPWMMSVFMMSVFIYIYK